MTSADEWRAAVRSSEGQPLQGGVSSDIRLFEHRGERYCIKQALPRLKVALEWRAPVARNHSEAEWLRVARTIAPEAAPEVVFEDREAGWFVMRYLPPERYPVWKNALRDGTIDVEFARAVGRQLVRIHRATAGRAEIAERFANADIFFPIRAEPYLLAPTAVHPDLAPALQTLADRLMRTTLALVHGDVSPKNILVGPQSPVFLDAECAWYGDPAFDVAFVLNHLLLKCIWRPQWTLRYLECFDALRAAYSAGVDWEAGAECEARTARMLPGLLLGRVDGRSPVEYVTDESDKAFIRSVARALLLNPLPTLDAIAATWRDACARRRDSTARATAEDA